MNRELEDRQFILRHNYPIVKAVIHKGGIKVIREQKTPLKYDWRPESNKVTKLSKSSLSRLAFLVRTTSVRFVSLLTLTYSAVANDGQIVKSQLNTFLTKLRYHFKGVSYVWFLEFQKRGAPHFHLLLTIEASDDNRKLIAKLWADIISNGSEDKRKIMAVHSHVKTFEQVREENGAKRYALKYALKPEQKTVPKRYKNVGRFWGNSRDVKPQDGIEIDITEDELREWLEIHHPDVNDRLPVMLPKHIFTDFQKPEQ